MADLVIPAATVLAGPLASKGLGIAGATIVAGQPLYKDAADGKLKIADADGDASSKVVGISLHAASDGQPLEYCISDTHLGGCGAGLDSGETLFLSETTGKISDAPAASGFTTVIGFSNGGDDSMTLAIANGTFIA